MATATATRCTGMSSQCTHCRNCVPHWSSIRLSASVVHICSQVSASQIQKIIFIWVCKTWSKCSASLFASYQYMVASLLVNSNYANHHHCPCFMFLDRWQIFLIVSHHTISLLHSYYHVYVLSNQAFIVISCDLALKSLYAYFIMS